LTLAGYFFGNIPFIKHNFSIAIMVIILISVTPMIFEFLRHRIRSRKDLSPEATIGDPAANQETTG
jgi:membrane-associated protein